MVGNPGIVDTAGARDTIAAIATAPGRGAVGIVRVSGERARAIAASVFRGRAPLRERYADFGEIVAADGARIDEGLRLFFAGPRSYTGEDVLELQVHGSPAVLRDVLLATLEAGARLAEPGEFTRRAFYAGKVELSQAEAVADLIAAEHRGAARGAAARLSGGLAREVEGHEAALAALLEELSASLDFPDEVEAPSSALLRDGIERVDAALAELADSWERGRLVREGLSVAIVGPPNAGKSSLLNALLGNERALVSALAGTTRDTIEETLALGNGAVARIVDTAGLRVARDDLEAAGIARTERALAESTLLLVVVDGAVALDDDGREALRRTRGRPRVVYFNKSDLGRTGFDERDDAERDALLGSVRLGSSLDAVRDALARHANAEAFDLARPHLGTVRQASAVLAARRALGFARRSLAEGAPVDLIVGDLGDARRALGELTGRGASEALLDAVFARFCIGK